MRNASPSRDHFDRVHPLIAEQIYRRNLDNEFPSTFGIIIEINRAHTVMLAEQGIIDGDNARALLAALSQMTALGPDAIPVDPRREESYFNHEAWIIAHAGAEAGGRLHTGRSRNDLGAAIDRLRARAQVTVLLGALNDLRACALARAETYADALMLGYTHMQPAQPITYGFCLAGIAAALERDWARLSGALERINRSPLGVAALAGTRHPIAPARTAELLGYDGLVENGLDGVAARDFLVEAAGAVAQAATSCSRLAQDFYAHATNEFSSLLFSDDVVGSSSIMPQKKNPVLLEHIKGLAGQIVGAHMTTAMSLVGTHYTVSIDTIRDDLKAAWTALDQTHVCLSLTQLAVEAAAPNGPWLAERLAHSFATVTDLADGLVIECGLPFRQAHAVVAAAVRDLPRGTSIADMDWARSLDAAGRNVLGREIGLSPATIAGYLDPGAVVASRKSHGGTAPDEVRRQVGALAERLTRDKGRLERFTQALTAARARLDDAERQVCAGA